MFPRSASKPLQAAAMVELGLDLDGELLALAAASHSGEPFHLDGVRRILAGAGLDVDALPYPARGAVRPSRPRRPGCGPATSPEPLTMNCSGKHAAMLATCVVNGWDVATYLDPEHPLQVALRAALERYAGEPVPPTGVDGCGAPLSRADPDRAGRARSAAACSPTRAARGGGWSTRCGRTRSGSAAPGAT